MALLRRRAELFPLRMLFIKGWHSRFWFFLTWRQITIFCKLDKERLQEKFRRPCNRNFNKANCPRKEQTFNRVVKSSGSPEMDSLGCNDWRFDNLCGSNQQSWGSERISIWSSVSARPGESKIPRRTIDDSNDRHLDNLGESYSQSKDHKFLFYSN